MATQGTYFGILCCLYNQDLTEKELRDKFLEVWPDKSFDYTFLYQKIIDNCQQIKKVDGKIHLDTCVDTFYLNLGFLFKIKKEDRDKAINAKNSPFKI